MRGGGGAEADSEGKGNGAEGKYRGVSDRRRGRTGRREEDYEKELGAAAESPPCIGRSGISCVFRVVKLATAVQMARAMPLP